MPNVESAVIGVDVGGTNTRAALVVNRTQGPEIIGDIKRIPSPSQKSREETVADFINLFSDVKRSGDERGVQVVAMGVGMPGPFNYETGESKMTGENKKYESIFGENLKDKFEAALYLPSYFLNDADAAGLGSHTIFPEQARLMYVGIGTGLGFSVVVEGKLRRDLPPSEQAKIPESIWDMPYNKVNLEEFVSKRAIENLYQELSRGRKAEVVEIAELAKLGNPYASTAFADMGRLLGYGITPVIKSVDPTLFVLGGQISRSYDLFSVSLKNALKGNSDVAITTATDEDLPIIGAGKFAFDRLSEAA